MNGKVLAMYDVRGIQNYIYRNPKIKDAMGASALVDHIIEDALAYGVKREKCQEPLHVELKWFDENGPLPYEPGGYDIYVQYIGGGNAYVTFRDAGLCRNVNRYMSEYIMKETYSLQLAAAFVPQDENYRENFLALQKEMQRVKDQMTDSKPLGALPVMKTELRTGYPMTDEDGSEESRLKEKAKKRLLEKEGDEKAFENLIREKGEDSTIAVVHLDGNNMGLRIRELVEDKSTYEEAVLLMRLISYNISHAYTQTFEEVKQEIEQGGDRKVIRKIIVAGDDITYVCTASEAIRSAELFSEKISGHTMIEEKDRKSSDEEIKKYGFSVCGGISYFYSHFPFDIAYDVAESLCDSAKERAKAEENRCGERIGNFIDFQICKDVRCRNLKETRQREYLTPFGENLLLRPYFISTSHDYEFEKRMADKPYQLAALKKYISYFGDQKQMPRSFAKRLRNTYSDGTVQLESFCAFLRSRRRKLPDHLDFSAENLFTELHEEGQITRTARYFDALDLMDIEGAGGREDE